MLNGLGGITNHRITYMKPLLYITIYDIMTDLKGSEGPRNTLYIRKFINMVLDSVKGQSPQITTFPHFFHKIPLRGSGTGFLGSGGKKHPVKRSR
jgi:hypothetical protein